MPHDSLSLQKAFGYLFENEIYALKELAQSLPPNPVVCNLGAGAGTSGLAFMESRDDITLWTIDIQRYDSPFGCLEAEYKVISEAFPEVRNYNNHRYIQMEGDSKVIGLMWQKPQWTLATADLYNSSVTQQDWGKGQHLVDMVFIDADHSYNGCKGDILAWLPNIKPGGIMAVHDFEKKKRWERGDIPDKAPHPLPWPGVDRAVRKFLCPYYEMILKVDTLVGFRIK